MFGTRSLRDGRITGGSPGSWIIILALSATVTGVVALHSGGWISSVQAVSSLLTPLLLVAAGFRPAWLILLLIGIPPGLLTPLGPTPLLLLAIGTLMAQFVVRGTAYLDWRSGMLPLGLLIAAALLFPADVGSDAAVAGTNFLRYFSYYVAISAVSYNAVRLGDLRRDHLANAMLVSMVGTALIKVALTGLAPPEIGDPGATLYFDRRFAYLAVLGFSVAFARWMVRRSEGRGSSWDFALAVFFLLLVGTSLVRGAWLAALLTLILVTGYAGRRSYWLLVPIALTLVLAVPIARDRVVPSPYARVDITTGRAFLWTTLWEDHIAPALPAGNGFGYTGSLTPEKLFGFRGFVTEGAGADQFVYPHNDFLFWMLEFGLWGLCLWLLYWTHLIAATRWLLRKGHVDNRYDAIIVVGVFVTMLIAQLTANGYALQPLAERFFVAAGFVFGTRAVVSSRQTDSSRVR